MELINDKIVLKGADDAVLKCNEGNYFIDLYIPPYGHDQVNEVSDSTYPLGNYRVPYHYHDRGIETFTVQKGHMELTLYGKRCICDEGDIVNIPPYVPHGMVFIDEGFVWREMFSDMNMIADHRDHDLVTRNFLPHAYNGDFMEGEYLPEHHYFGLPEPAAVEWVEKTDLPQITARESAVYSFDGIDGLSLSLKVGRWALKGLKEVWEIKLDKNYQLQYFDPSPSEGVYLVKSGRLMLEADGKVLFPEAGDIVHVPQYTPYTLTALTDDALVHDYNVTSRLFRMLEMLEAAEPAQRDDPEWVKWLKKANNCKLSGIEKTETICSYTPPA